MSVPKSINYSIQIKYPEEEIARILANGEIEPEEQTALMLLLFNEFFKQLKSHKVFDENILAELNYLIEEFFDDIDLDDCFDLN
ncbi:MAG: hypothetical protein ABFD00_00570 [Chloroherpetonaceae bacterium]